MLHKFWKWLVAQHKPAPMSPEPTWEDGTPMTAEERPRDTDEVFGKSWWMRR